MSGGSGSGPLVPTFHGFIHNSMDGLILFEACLSGKLNHVPRRPHDRERTSLIKSGSIFIYEENASGIKRWTDGVAWSPSRILGNFLIYRELEKPFPPGEKKRAMKRKRDSQMDSPLDENGPDEKEKTEPPPEVKAPPTPPTPKPVAPEQAAESTVSDADRELDRQLIGSLVDSYGFRPDGLVKKTMSIAIHGVSHHLVSYYKVDDVKQNVLRRPVEDPRLANIAVRPDLYMKQNFRTPVEDPDHYVMESNGYHQHSGSYGQVMHGGYGMRANQYMQPSGYAVYGVPPPTGGAYNGAAVPGWSSAQQHPGYTNGSYASQNYNDYYPRTSSSTPQSSVVKQEEQTHGNGSYNNAGGPAAPYSASGARPTSSNYSNMPPQYHPPMRPPTTNFPPTTGGQHTSPTVATGPGHQSYGHHGASPHPIYDTKPPAPAYSPSAPPAANYSTHAPPHGGATQEQVKEPQSAGSSASASGAAHGSLAPPMQYRPQPYPAQDATHQHEVGPLSMGQSYATSGHSAPTPYHGSTYANYAPPAQSYRPPVDSTPAVSTQAQY
ncbi:hypothetical protein ANO11243_048210 [Dothideomycetidae sp. 11243]|nr:hypothetical protein ANO11243_048210 [fungal sp. No.11243]